MSHKEFRSLIKFKLHVKSSSLLSASESFELTNLVNTHDKAGATNELTR